MIAPSRHACRRRRRVLLLGFFFLRSDGIKDALALFLIFGPFRGIYFAARPLLS
jgi:hypothetical protein